VQPTDDGRIRVVDQRFLEAGAVLSELGVPADVTLDEWEALAAHTDEIAERFVAVFERHLAPADWEDGLGTDEARALAETLARLHATARVILTAALDASLARLGRERLGALVGR
jgi:hypothetical protein